MLTKDLKRAYAWSDKNHTHDLLAKYYFHILLTLGTFSEFDKNPEEIDVPLYAHLNVHNELCELRDFVAKEIIVKIKGQRI